MDDLAVNEATWEALPEPVEDVNWVIRVIFTGSGLIDRALPLVASVGGIPVEALSGSPLGRTAQGFLAAVPPVGAKLVIGYPDTGPFKTTIEFPGISEPQIA